MSLATGDLYGRFGQSAPIGTDRLVMLSDARDRCQRACQRAVCENFLHGHQDGPVGPIAPANRPALLDAGRPAAQARQQGLRPRKSPGGRHLARGGAGAPALTPHGQTRPSTSSRWVARRARRGLRAERLRRALWDEPATILRMVQAAPLQLTPPRPAREPQDQPPPQAAVPSVALVVSLRRRRARGWLRLRDGMSRPGRQHPCPQQRSEL